MEGVYCARGLALKSHSVSAGLASVVSLQVRLAQPISTLDARSETANGEVSEQPWALNPRDGMGLPWPGAAAGIKLRRFLSLRIAGGSQPHLNRSCCPERALAVNFIHISRQPAFVRCDVISRLLPTNLGWICIQSLARSAVFPFLARRTSCLLLFCSTTHGIVIAALQR
ncbi:hypothetical protein FB567DRAFT_119793 [Paraphoma chrysanthemicola]|uniref:Uncharacterized protein n=1 Tax=Paraphoma chrysanthemicola TaxID=798071 RepID=A0A8K0R1F9_9PLEO|nr:hypothetical protein FB567DRAFT_119793 [Paraphoma chrysanthemicola]